MSMSARKSKQRTLAAMASAPPAQRAARQAFRMLERFASPLLSHAILIGHEVKTCNLMTWARWMEAQRGLKGKRGGCGLHVADETVGNARVSTIFLGLNHAFGPGPGLWFETMVFIRDYAGDAEMERYSTWEEAEAGHARMVQRHRSPDPSGFLLDRLLRAAEIDMDKEDES